MKFAAAALLLPTVLAADYFTTVAYSADGCADADFIQVNGGVAVSTCTAVDCVETSGTWYVTTCSTTMPDPATDIPSTAGDNYASQINYSSGSTCDATTFSNYAAYLTDACTKLDATQWYESTCDGTDFEVNLYTDNACATTGTPVVDVSVGACQNLTSSTAMTVTCGASAGSIAQVAAISVASLVSVAGAFLML